MIATNEHEYLRMNTRYGNSFGNAQNKALRHALVHAAAPCETKCVLASVFELDLKTTTEQRMASRVIAHPERALKRLPAFQALPKMYRYGRKPVINISETSAW